VEHILQGVDIMLVDVSSMHVQSSALVQFAVSATVTLASSRNHCVKNDDDLMNVLQNALLAVILILSTVDSGLPDPVITTCQIMPQICHLQ